MITATISFHSFRLPTRVPGLVRRVTTHLVPLLDVELTPKDSEMTSHEDKEEEDDGDEEGHFRHQDFPKVNMGPPGDIAKTVWKAAVGFVKWCVCRMERIMKGYPTFTLNHRIRHRFIIGKTYTRRTPVEETH